MKRCWVGTSWKMNKTLAEGLAFAEALVALHRNAMSSFSPS